MRCLLFSGVLPVLAAAEANGSYDLLVYQDGDRVKGQLIAEKEGEIIFRSARFGVLHVSKEKASVLRNQDTPTSLGKAAVEAQAAASGTPLSSQNLQTLPAAETNPAAHWTGHLSVAGDFDRNQDRTRTYVVELGAERTWPRNTFKAEARYEFSRVNGVLSTDLFKTNVDWRYDLSARVFSVYHPSVEINRAFTYESQPADYLFARQELGPGLRVLKTQKIDFKAGVLGIYYDIWTLYHDAHFNKALPAFFDELEWKLTSKTQVIHRGEWYYTFASQKDGWEIHDEITRSLSSRLKLSFEHDIRHNSPDLRLSDEDDYHLLLRFDY